MGWALPPPPPPPPPAQETEGRQRAELQVAVLEGKLQVAVREGGRQGEAENLVGQMREEMQRQVSMGGQ